MAITRHPSTLNDDEHINEKTVCEPPQDAETE